MLLSVLSPTVQCQWGLSNSEAAAITSVSALQSVYRFLLMASLEGYDNHI